MKTRSELALALLAIALAAVLGAFYVDGCVTCTNRGGVWVAADNAWLGYTCVERYRR